MKVEYKGFVSGPQSPASEILSALAMASARGDKPHLLGYTPVARMNPFQALLYRRFFDNGIANAPILRPETFRELLEFKDMARSVSLHLHWNSWMTYGRTQLDEARRMSMGVIGRLEQLRARGGNLVWTVHNVYPHDAMFVELELEVQQRIADLASTVHVMSKSTVRAMKDTLNLDETKIVHAPHPNYKGAYPDFITREEARSTLGLDPDEVVFVLFGAIKPYKGLARLLNAVELLKAMNPGFRFRLLVAGGADNSPEAAEFIKRSLVHPDVLIESSRVPADRAQYFLRAADIGLVNYSRVLNSGAALLYQTFGLPIVAADVDPLREAIPDAFGEFAEDSSAQAFAEAMFRAANRFENQVVGAKVMNYISQFDPDIVSDAFARELLLRFKA